MPYFYFFQKDKNCLWMRSELYRDWPYYMSGPISYEQIGAVHKRYLKPYEGKKQFHVISDWVTHKRTDKIPEAQLLLKEFGFSIVKSVKDLPEGDGIYVTGYDSAADEIKDAEEQGITIIKNPCPWIGRLKKQILSVNHETHQCVFMVDKNHILYSLYKSICPEDTIYILPENYEDEINRSRNGKPIHLLCYVTFRVSEIEKVISFIDTNYSHSKNNLLGYKETMCCWTKQGIYEELKECINEKNIKKFWLIYTSETDRSLLSLINEMKDLGVEYLMIRTIGDIPASVKPEDRIGIIITPVPIAPSVLNGILDQIKKRFSLQ